MSTPIIPIAPPFPSTNADFYKDVKASNSQNNLPHAVNESRKLLRNSYNNITIQRNVLLKSLENENDIKFEYIKSLINETNANKIIINDTYTPLQYMICYNMPICLVEYLLNIGANITSNENTNQELELGISSLYHLILERSNKDLLKLFLKYDLNFFENLILQGKSMATLSKQLIACDNIDYLNYILNSLKQNVIHLKHSHADIYEGFCFSMKSILEDFFQSCLVNKNFLEIDNLLKDLIVCVDDDYVLEVKLNESINRIEWKLMSILNNILELQLPKFTNIDDFNKINDIIESYLQISESLLSTTSINNLELDWLRAQLVLRLIYKHSLNNLFKIISNQHKNDDISVSQGVDSNELNDYFIENTSTIVFFLFNRIMQFARDCDYHDYMLKQEIERLNRQYTYNYNINANNDVANQNEINIKTVMVKKLKLNLKLCEIQTRQTLDCFSRNSFCYFNLRNNYFLNLSSIKEIELYQHIDNNVLNELEKLNKNKYIDLFKHSLSANIPLKLIEITRNHIIKQLPNNFSITFSNLNTSFNTLPFKLRSFLKYL